VDGEVVSSIEVDTPTKASTLASSWYSGLMDNGIFQTKTPMNQMQSLTAIAHMIIQHRAAQPVDIDFLVFGMATEYLRLAIGNEWTNEVAFAQHTVVTRPRRSARGFMRSESVETADRFRHQQRVLRLAELVANLQTVEGLHARIDDLRAGKLEDTLAELEVAAFLQRRGLAFRFVTRSGHKGSDYDGELRLGDGSRVPCEVKCKVESTSVTKTGVLNSLNDARKQLPPNELGLIYLKIPEDWLPELSSIVTPTATEFLERTSRVIAVTLIWEEFHRAATAFEYRFRLIPRRQSESTLPVIVDLLRLLSEFSHRNEIDISFRALAAEILAHRQEKEP
jgi:hypothetical protein